MSCLTAADEVAGGEVAQRALQGGAPAQACAFQAKPRSGSRRNDSRWLRSTPSSSPHRLTMSASTARTGPPGSRGGPASSGRRASKVSADTQAASSAASGRPRRSGAGTRRRPGPARCTGGQPLALGVTLSPST